MLLRTGADPDQDILTDPDPILSFLSDFAEGLNSHEFDFFKFAESFHLG